jgi:hypothetical protein
MEVVETCLGRVFSTKLGSFASKKYTFLQTQVKMKKVSPYGSITYEVVDTQLSDIQHNNK